ncbi:PHP domain-containing protein [Salinisphaera sp. T31B1]|uniref:PHP domain-containing protein n=1 Tax=Salinisphaera sp. T31B1 TaxID=727963 RepID=UPI0033425E7B
MIDLHCHSTASDGRLRPGEVVARAAQAGVRRLALTDHDTTAGLAEARDVADRVDVRLIAGVEISVTWQKRTLHVVGLGFDADDPGLSAGLAELQQARDHRARAIAQKLSRLGLDDGYERACRLADGGQIARPHFARLLVEDGLCKDMNQAFKRYLRPGKPGHRSIQWAGLDDAIGWIHGAGGIAVLAHPFGYGFSAAWRRRAVAAFADAGGHALEICTGTTERSQEITAAAHAREHGLLGSVGSDFHAPEQFWLGLGRLRDLPSGVAPVWDDARLNV